MSLYKRTHAAPPPDADLVPHEYRADAEKLRELFPAWTVAGTPVLVVLAVVHSKPPASRLEVR